MGAARVAVVHACDGRGVAGAAARPAGGRWPWRWRVGAGGCRMLVVHGAAGWTGPRAAPCVEPARPFAAGALSPELRPRATHRRPADHHKRLIIAKPGAPEAAHRGAPHVPRSAAARPRAARRRRPRRPRRGRRPRRRRRAGAGARRHAAAAERQGQGGVGPPRPRGVCLWRDSDRPPTMAAAPARSHPPFPAAP